MGRDKNVEPAQLRAFGLIVGGMFAVVAFWPTLLRGEDPRVWFVIASGSLVLPALILPTSLRSLYNVWMRVGAALGWVNTRIILSIGFYGVFTPMGTIMRLFGRDPLRRRFDADVTTYRVARLPRPGSHMQRQF